MAVARWEPKANAVAQVDTITIAGTGNFTTGDQFTITINTKTLLITVGTLVQQSEVVTLIKQAWQSETLTDTTATVVPSGGGQSITEFAEITATSAALVVTLTHDTEGVPFTMVVAETTMTGDHTGTETTATPATGPNHWDDVNNWSGGIVPVATTADEVYIDNSDVSILYGLVSASTVTTITIASSFTGDIGLPKTNAAGYVEYRADYLNIKCPTVNIGGGEGSGSGRIKLDLDSVATKVIVESTGAAAEFGVESFLFLGSAGTNEVIVYTGSVGISSFGGETASVATLNVTSGTVKCGTGCTLGVITSQTGDITFEDNAGTVTNGSGVMTVRGSATITTLNIDGGTVNYLSIGTITAANIGGKGVGATLDVSLDMRAKNITTTTLRQNGTIFDPLQTITHANKIALGAEVQSISAT